MRKIHLMALVAGAAVLAPALLGCSDDDGPGPDAAPLADGAVGDGAVPDAGPANPDAVAPDAAVTCEATPVGLRAARPRFVILLDQSSSMRGSVSWLPGRSHWDEARDGIQALVTDPSRATWWFGLDPFPDGTLSYLQQCYDECCSDPSCMINQMFRCQALAQQCGRTCAVDLPPIVPLASATTSATAILDYLSLDYVPPSYTSTPLVAQLEYYTTLGATAVPELYAGDGLSYLLVLSDGDDTCFDSSETPDVPAITAALAAATRTLRDQHGIRSLAIGFGDTSGNLAQELNAIAANGGTPFSTFFAVDAAGDLATAMDTIAASAPRCLYQITDPTDLVGDEPLTVTLDGTEIPFDQTCVNGWHWATPDTATALHLELCGVACEAVAGDPAATLEVQLPCPE